MRGLGGIELGRAACALAAVGLGVGAGCGGGGGAAGELLADLQFSALVDTNGDGQCHDDAASTARLSDYLAERRPGTRILMVNAAAGWCEPCQREAARSPRSRPSTARAGSRS